MLVLAAVVALASIGGCGEKLDAGRSCPLLCPEQSIALRDTTIDAAIVTDTTILGLPPIGSEAYLMLASHGDTAETRAIIRYDTLPQTFTINSIDSTITKIDSAFLLAPIIPDSVRLAKSPVTIEAYDVDTVGIDSTAADTVAATLSALFRPDRFLGSATFAPESLLKDTLRIPVSTDSVLAAVVGAKRFRVGLKLVTATGFDLRLGTTESSNSVTLQIKASLDTAATPVMVTPVSSTPPNQTFLSGPLADYTIVVNGLTSTPANLLSVGGLPSRRTFLRFDLPSRIIDSTTVVRASLLLTQSPNRRLDAGDSIYVYPLAVLASPAVTDIGTLLGFLGANGQFGLDSLKLTPGDSGVKSFEIVGLVRAWHQQATTLVPRTVALRSGAEAQLPAQFDFFSTRALAALRPRLRITYVPQSSFGVP